MDIVKRLRERRLDSWADNSLQSRPDQLASDAADEIERLRHRLSDAGDVVSAAYWLLAWTNQHLLSGDPRAVAACLRDLDPARLNTSEGNLVRALRAYIDGRTVMMAPPDGMAVTKHPHWADPDFADND